MVVHWRLTFALVVTAGLTACGGGLTAGAGSSGAEPPSASSGAEPPSPTGTIAHPRRANELVVSVTSPADGLSFVSAPWSAVGRPARYLLHGDGHVLVPASAEAGRDGRIPVLATYRLSEEGIQTVLRQAEAAGLLVSHLDYGEPEILDVGATFVTVHAGGREYHHSAYALGLDDSVQPERRRALLGFIGYLESLASARPDLLSAAPRPYRPRSVDVFAWPADATASEESPSLDWPLAQPLSRLPVSELDEDAGCASIRGADLAAVARELEAWPASTDAFPVWRSGKQSWRVAFDVNVPGEEPCPAAARAG